MAPRNRPSMGTRLDGADATVTPIARRGRGAFSAETEAPVPAAGAGSAVEIPIALIDPSPANPRSSLGDLDELAASIKELGVLQPVLVRPNGERYDLIYGHRRLAASTLAKRKTVPVLFSLDEDEARDHARRLVENLHREDLSALDEARAYQQLLALGVAGGQRGLAKLVGVSQALVSKRLALLELPEDVRAKVDSGVITVTDAVELARLADDPAAVKRAVKAAKDGWGGYAGAVKRELQTAADKAARDAAEAALRKAGVTILAGDPYLFNRQEGPYGLRSLMHQADITEEDHAKLACHAAVIPKHGPDVVLVCLDPQSHLGGSRESAAEEQARIAAEQAALHEARLAATQARREFMVGLVRKGSPDPGGGVLLGQALGGRHYYLRIDEEIVADLLGLAPDTLNGKGSAAAIEAYVAKGTRNSQRAVYAVGLALGETAVTGREATGQAVRAHFDHLVACGYLLSDFEKNLLAEEDEDLEDEEFDDDEGEGGEA